MVSKENLLLPTGRKESFSVSKGSVVEVSSSKSEYIWFCAILEENLSKSKRKKISVRHLEPLLKEEYSPPALRFTFRPLIRPVPPSDLFLDVDFEVGDVIDAARDDGWWSGSVMKVLGNGRYLVYLRYSPIIEVDRKNLRPHLVWKDEEWFRCEKQELKIIEVRTEVEHLGDVWAPAIAIKDYKNDTLVVKYNDHFKAQILPNSKIRPPQPPPPPPPPPLCVKTVYKLMENVEAFLETGWCPGVISNVQIGFKYCVLLGRSKESQVFDHLQLRPSMEWKNGVWQPQELFQAEGVRDIKALGTGKHCSSMQQNPSHVSSNGGYVAEAGKVYATESVTPFSKTAGLSGELGSQTGNAVRNEKTLVTSQPEIAASVAATVRTQGKTSPRKKLQAMKKQKGCANDCVEEKEPEEMNNRESVNKRKRGQPRKFVSSKPKQKAMTIDFTNMTDDDQPLASWIHRGKAASRTLDPILNSVVEKHIDVMETPRTRDTTMVLPFAKKSPLWKFLETMEHFKAVPQHPHFSPLLENEEECREGDAIGAMVMFIGLLEKVNKIQIDDPVISLHRISECFLKLEKHGFHITAPRTRIEKLLSIKESHTWALDESKAVEKEMTEKDEKRRKCEEDIEEISRKILELKEEKLRMEKEIAKRQSHETVLDQKVQNIEQEFRANVTAQWK